MRTTFLSLLSLCAAVDLLGSAATAQGRAPADAIGPPGFAMDHVHGVVHDVDGAPWLIGRDYKARVADGALEFTPALGSRAPHNLPLTFRLQTIVRGGEIVHAVTATTSAPAQAVEAQAVTFARGSVLERYECRPEGVEQSFVFAERPAGSGDLVVRGTITTTLQPTTRGDGTLFFSDGRTG